MSSPWRNFVCAESNQKSDANEKGKACSNDNEASFLFLLFEIEISRSAVKTVIPIFSKIIAMTDNCIERKLPA